jgi:hypothetical protein
VLPLHSTGIGQEPDGAVTRRYELLLISNFIFIILKSKQNKTIYIIKIIIFLIFFLGKKIGNREATETLLSFQMNGGWVPLQDEIIFYPAVTFIVTDSYVAHPHSSGSYRGFE